VFSEWFCILDCILWIDNFDILFSLHFPDQFYEFLLSKRRFQQLGIGPKTWLFGFLKAIYGCWENLVQSWKVRSREMKNWFYKIKTTFNKKILIIHRFSTTKHVFWPAVQQKTRQIDVGNGKSHFFDIFWPHQLVVCRILCCMSIRCPAT
jgi:hypothetical protein